MATTTRGRSKSRMGTGFAAYGGWGSTGSSRTKKRSTSAGSTAGYKNVCTTLQKRINSFRVLMNQTKGAAKFPRPTPTTLNTFANWIGKGAVVHNVTCAQVGRWANATHRTFSRMNPTAAACKNVLVAKYGKNAIKAVTRAKNGSFLVVTSPTVGGRAFAFPR